MPRLRDIESAEQIPLEVLLQEAEQAAPSSARAEAPRLMWSWTGSTFEQELDAALPRFREKFGTEPVAIYVNMMDAQGLPVKEITAARGLRVRAAVNVLPGKFELAGRGI